MDDSTLRLDEASARRLVLVRAIEEVDTQGKLLSEVEREQLERDALEASRRAAPASDLDLAQYLQQRARKVLAAVENRQPQLAALQDVEPWQRWVLWALPLIATLAGATLDRIDNPQQVNMLSPPLVGVLAWNLGMYVLLLVFAFAPPAWHGAGLVAVLQRWLSGVPAYGRRTGRLRIDISARFHQQWLQATSRQQLLWFKQLLHWSAAGWGLGVAVSILVGGLVRQYRVGWESTLLDLHQVHAILHALFAPVVALLPFEAFTQADLQRMAFGSGAAIGVEEARRWVWMYVALLALVVLVPRTLLAGWAAWRRGRLARAVRIDLSDPYFVEVLARVSPARVTLAVLSRPGRGNELVQRLLQEAAERSPRASAPRTVLTTPKGDALRLFEIPPDYQPPHGPGIRPDGGGTAAQAWLQELLGRFKARTVVTREDELQAALADTDLVLLLPGGVADLEQATRLLHWVAQPALVLADAATDAQLLDDYRAAVRRLGLAADVFDLEAAAGHWLREARLLEAIGTRLATSKRAGFARLAAAWSERNERRFDAAMQLLAELLVRAAREHEEVGGAPINLRHLVSPGEREAGQRARETAAQALLARVRAEEAAMLVELLRLYRLEPPAAPVRAPRMDEGFIVQQAVDVPQAGMAGAATGAAMGAGIDLMTGGITLGAAAALGALIGGGAAYLGAALKNRSAPAGRGLVQLSEEMLATITESTLAGYLGVAYRQAAAPGEAPLRWRSEVVAAVASRRQELAPLWAQARLAACEDQQVTASLAQVLGGMARSLLSRVEARSA